jgi:hypothetical protein
LLGSIKNMHAAPMPAPAKNPAHELVDVFAEPCDGMWETPPVCHAELPGDCNTGSIDKWRDSNRSNDWRR